MPAPDIRSTLTGDGSSTLYTARFDEHYHSVHGAIQESQHVFIEAGLRPLLHRPGPIRIFEMGFGTGLNALLTALVAARPAIIYTSIEAYPLDAPQWSSLNYGTQLGGDAAQWLQRLHAATWDQAVDMGTAFTLHKQVCTWEAFHPTEAIDLIYYDAFAPGTQPELWTLAVMERCYEMMAPGGVWVSYCAKGDVRRALTAAGFTVERLPGPPGKRQMLRATK